AQLGQSRERRVAVDPGGALVRARCERVDDVLRRRQVGVAATEVDERFAARRRGGLDTREQTHEVLLGEPVEPARPLHASRKRTGRMTPPRLGTSRTVLPLRERSGYVDINPFAR